MNNYSELDWKKNINLFIHGLLNQLYLLWLIQVNNVIFNYKEWPYYLRQIITPVHDAGKRKTNFSATWLCIFLPWIRAARPFFFLALRLTFIWLFHQWMHRGQVMISEINKLKKERKILIYFWDFSVFAETVSVTKFTMHGYLDLGFYSNSNKKIKRYNKDSERKIKGKLETGGLLHRTRSGYRKAQMSENVTIIFHHTIFPRVPHPWSFYQNITSGAPRMINQKKIHFDPEASP